MKFLYAIVNKMKLRRGNKEAIKGENKLRIYFIFCDGESDILLRIMLRNEVGDC